MSACTVWRSHHQLTVLVFLPHSHIYILQPNFSSALLSFHPQAHWFWKCSPVFLAVSLLAPLSDLSLLLVLVSSPRLLPLPFGLFLVFGFCVLCIWSRKLPFHTAWWAFRTQGGILDSSLRGHFWHGTEKPRNSITGRTFISPLGCALWTGVQVVSDDSLADLYWTCLNCDFAKIFSSIRESVKIKVSCC